MFPVEHMTDFWLQAAQCKTLKHYGLTQQQIAQKLNVSRADVSHLIRFNQLTPSIQLLLKMHRLSKTHVRVLLPIESDQQKKLLIYQTVKRQWSAAELKCVVNALLAQPNNTLLALPLDEIKKTLSQQTGLQVAIKERQGFDDQGIIAFTFKNKDELTAIINKLCS